MTDEGRKAGLIRPYILTGGRTAASRPGLRLETLVEALEPAGPLKLTSEQQAILDHAVDPASIAELSAWLHLPIAVVTILVGDLMDLNLLRVHETDPVEIELSALTRMIERVRAL